MHVAIDVRQRKSACLQTADLCCSLAAHVRCTNLSRKRGNGQLRDPPAKACATSVARTDEREDSFWLRERPTIHQDDVTSGPQRGSA